MTRKDYINIAAAILATQERIKGAIGTPEEKTSQLRGVRRAAAHLTDFLADDNPRFDPAVFLTNCGYGATTMNPSDPALDLRPLPKDELEHSRKAWAGREETARQPRPVPPVEDFIA